MNIYSYINAQENLSASERTFTLGYAEALLWSSGVPLDNDINAMDESALQYLDQCSESLCNDAVRDCLEHLSDATGLIGRAIANVQGYTMEQAGHDFALTRNHHGAGYWDRDLGNIGEQLTILAHDAGSIDLYLGDDGLLYSD